MKHICPLLLIYLYFTMQDIDSMNFKFNFLVVSYPVEK